MRLRPDHKCQAGEILAAVGSRRLRTSTSFLYKLDGFPSTVDSCSTPAYWRFYRKLEVPGETMADSQYRQVEVSKEEAGQDAQPARHQLSYAVTTIVRAVSSIHSRAFEQLKDDVLESVIQIASEVRDFLRFRAPPESVNEALRSLQVPTHDVEEHCHELLNQIAADRFGGMLPCRRVGESRFTPVSLGEVIKNESAYFGDNSDDTAHLPIEDGANNFCDELIDFLVTRIASQAIAGSGSGSGRIGNVPLMLPVRVFSPTLNARVSYSPAYFHNYTVFGAPTSPATSQVPPGRYVFLIDLPNGKKYDRSLFDIPPSYDVHLIV